MQHRGWLVGALVALVGAPVTVVVLSASPAGAAGPGCQSGDIEVLNANNTGANSLRAAFVTATGLAGPQRICVDTTVVGPITLTTGEVLYNAGTTPGLTVEGNGITVSGNNASRVIDNNTTGSLTLDQVTITGGNTAGAGGGGGVFSSGPVTITNSTITGNTASVGVGGGVALGTVGTALTVTNSTISTNIATASAGGGTDSIGVVTVTNSTFSGNTSGTVGGGARTTGGLFTVTNSTFSGNTAGTTGGGIDTNNSVTVTSSTFSTNTASGGDGGGVRADGTVTVRNSTFSGNIAGGGTGNGGGINAIGAVTITNSTLSTNHADDGGGALSASGAVTITNSTISNNTATLPRSGGGGGIRMVGDPTVTLVYATIASNSSPAGANLNLETVGSLTSFGSVIALPLGGGANCANLISTTSNGYNFSDDASCGFTASTDKQNAGDPQLGALANNGGSTQTRLPQAGSPLIDAIPVAHCTDDGAALTTTDQIGTSRPQGTGCEIGALEVIPAAIVAKFTG